MRLVNSHKEVDSLNFGIIWVTLLIIILIFSILKPFISDYVNTSVIAITIHILFSVFILLKSDNSLKYIFIGALLARVVLLFWDVYFQHIFVLPNSGIDSEMFYGQALMVSNDLSLIGENIRGGLFAKITGFMFYFTGPMRPLGQYLNVLIGVMVVFIVYKITLLFNFLPSISKRIILITAFFPNSMVMSAIFLREILPTFFVALSIYFFIKWYKKSTFSTFIISTIALAIAAAFHSGVIGLFFGYAFMLLFYHKEQKTFKASLNSVFAFVLIGLLVSFISSRFGDTVFSQFNKINDLSDIYSEANLRLGESAYLTGLTINNPIQFILFAPIKAIYFLFSPMPWDWRGGMDIFSFFFDSSLYLFTIYMIFSNWKYFNNKALIVGIIIMIIGAAIIFGIGVGNAGTAIRHRQKIVVVVICLLGLIQNEKYLFVKTKINQIINLKRRSNEKN